jgi:hypothetical protein
VEGASVSKLTGAVHWLVAVRIDKAQEEARTDCIASVNKVVHQLLSRIICVVVVIEPTLIHSIAYIHHQTTPTN